MEDTRLTIPFMRGPAPGVSYGAAVGLTATRKFCGLPIAEMTCPRLGAMKSVSVS